MSGWSPGRTFTLTNKKKLPHIKLRRQQPRYCDADGTPNPDGEYELIYEE